MEQLTAADLVRLASKGGTAPTRGLLAQFDYSKALFLRVKEILLTAGLTEEQLNDFIADGNQVGAASSKQHDAQLDAQGATTVESSGITGGKDHAYVLRQLIPMLVRKHKITLRPDAVAPSGTLGRSTSRIVDYLERSRGTVVQLEQYLRPYFHGESPVDVHDRILKALRDADGNQESKRSKQVEDTRELLIAKGKLLEALEDINRIGRIAFMGKAEIAAQFNKDILWRARRKGRKGSGEPTGETETPATSTTTDTGISD
jgi:hypothetical protein